MAVAAIIRSAIRLRGLRPAATTAAVTRPYIRAASASNGTGSNSLSARCRVSVRDRHHHRLAVCRRDRPARRPGPKLRTAVRDAKKAGYAYVVLDGTLIPIDWVAADRPFYSGKHCKHGMNLQVIASPDGDILWVSGALPGSVHDKKAERIWASWTSWRPQAWSPWPTTGTRAPRTRRSRIGARTSRNPRSGQPRPRETPRTRRASERPA